MLAKVFTMLFAPVSVECGGRNVRQLCSFLGAKTSDCPFNSGIEFMLLLSQMVNNKVFVKQSRAFTASVKSSLR